MKVFVVVLLCLAVTEITGQGLPIPDWHCQELHPRDEIPLATTPSPFRVKVDRTRVKPGDTINVELSVVPSHSMHGFIMQMRHPGTNSSAVGKWSVKQRSARNAMPASCFGEPNDTVTNRLLFAAPGHELSWTAPANIPSNELNLILVGAAMDGLEQLEESEETDKPKRGAYWHLHGGETIVEIQVVREETENPPVNPGDQVDQNGNEEPDQNPTLMTTEDEHDLLIETRMEQEYLQRKQEDIAMENLNTEADALAAIEDQKKKHDEEYKWELEDYEKKKYEEAIRRQARIDAELRDKEEWDARKRAEEEEEKRREEERRANLGDTLVEIDINEKPGIKTGAASRHTAAVTLYVVLAACLARLL